MHLCMNYALMNNFCKKILWKIILFSILKNFWKTERLFENVISFELVLRRILNITKKNILVGIISFNVILIVVLFSTYFSLHFKSFINIHLCLSLYIKNVGVIAKKGVLYIHKYKWISICWVVSFRLLMW